ncbi:oxidoreductase [Pigmentiphaga sp. H8]|uniref:PDR/VanB family oxidoreductase n=1 Tax=Pigmentiphaga sp. H8 TaxID=2488560 RepID=UPI000F5AFBF2|nr:PDR/VanB family oxidoreductase [Pigmentiphaga sp. H8]AZG08807.1 oxidoreductase [Pigmentiphaga sp. H8]
MKLLIQEVRTLTSEIRRFVLALPDAGPLPRYAPGAHIRVQVALPDGRIDLREYSLLGDGSDERRYEIAVLRCADGRGGSAWMHARQAGDILDVLPPANHFALAGEAREHLLIAGGIGITPILSMARGLRRSGAAFELHYAARTAGHMALREEARATGASVHLYYDDAEPLRDALPGLLAQHRPGRHLYVCGPRALIAGVVSGAAASGWPASHVHYELFAGALSLGDDQPFDLVARASGTTVRVEAGQTMLDALLAAGIEPLYDCRRGECGMCVTSVAEGEPDHRDHYLSARERAAGDVVCVCVSRARTPVLVLDI